MKFHYWKFMRGLDWHEWTFGFTGYWRRDELTAAWIMFGPCSAGIERHSWYRPNG
jgi:hypothetical protein